MTTAPHYRSDIDGLRAIAVLLVLIFHFFPTVLPSGFMGVSVFFVLSGYLISTVILGDIAKGRFSFLGFYLRRITRIFPLLLVTLVATTVAGWYLLFTFEYKSLASHVFASAVFVQNFNLIREAGYFDTSSATKPLLHLWSIAIEEQFYIIWPLILVLAARFVARLWVFTLALVVLGYGLAVWMQADFAAMVYYHPLSRGWELLAGAFVASLIHARPAGAQVPPKVPLANGAVAMGLVILLAAALVIDPADPYPVPYALLPVLGTCLLIWAGQQSPWSQVVLGRTWMASIGKRSYALYLFHWPILSFIAIHTDQSASNVQLLMGFFGAIVAAYLGHYLVEQPVARHRESRLVAGLLVLTMAALAACAWLVLRAQDLPQRNPAHEKLIASIQSPRVIGRCFEIENGYRRPQDWHCALGASGGPVIAFAYGDSHALSLFPALESYAQSKGAQILFTGNSGCPPLLGIQSLRGEENIEKYNCRLLNERIFKHVQEQGIKNVILAARWTYYTISKSRPSEFNPIAPADDANNIPDMPAGDISVESSTILRDAMARTVQRYAAIGTRVIFLRDVPQQIVSPPDILRKTDLTADGVNALAVSAEEHRQNQSAVNDLIGQTSPWIIDLDPDLCGADRCPLVQDGQFLYSDDDHLSIFGAMQMLPSLTRQLDLVLSD